MNCRQCTREVVDKLPKESGQGQCGGCHKPIYGLYAEDCRQVILREDYENSKWWN
jgi:hypothetical protein